MQRLGVILVSALALSALLTSCNGTLFVELEVASWSVERYVNYGTITLVGVTNTTSRALSRVVITARCYEDQFESLTTDFASQPFAIAGDETLSQVSLEHTGGWPNFGSFNVFCSFDAMNRAWPGEPEANIHVAH